MRTLVLSGCTWGDTGGAQRPVQLARCFRDLGHAVAYHCDQNYGDHDHDGVRLATRDTAAAFTADLVLCAWPGFADLALAHQTQGATLVYDCLDDWGAFWRAKLIHHDVEADERRLCEAADVVTATAEALLDRAAHLGARAPVLVPNGGPGRIILRTREKPPQGSPVLAVFSGATYCADRPGSWLDLDLLRAVAKGPGTTLTIIGPRPPGRWPKGTMMYGELPHAEALEAMARHDVGLVPFRGELSAAVDPCKAYDYWAAGLHVVTTEAVRPLAGRPWMLVAHSQTNFVECVRRAGKLSWGDRPDADFVAGAGWARRAEALLAAVGTEWRPRQRPFRLGGGLREEDCALRVTWAAPATCNAQCPYCNNAHDRAGLTALSRPASWWVEGFTALHRMAGGPLYLSVCWGEPLSSPEVMRIVARLAEDNKIDLVTNLLGAPVALAPLPRNGNIALATSYHPHLWPDGVPEFLAQRAEVEESGIRCGVVGIVAWPPYLAQLAGWVAEFAAAGVTADVLPFQGHFEGRAYPGAYTDEERRLFGLGECSDETARPTAGLPCRTGADYVYVEWDGTVRRCYMLGAERMGDLTLGRLALREGATPCTSAHCPCPDMWRYQVGGGGCA